MFSEYTSKFLSQSQQGSNSTHNAAPLFHSALEEEEENNPENSFRSLYKKKNTTGASGWISSFANRNNTNSIIKESDEEEDDGLEPRWEPMVESTDSQSKSISKHENLDSIKLSQEERGSGDSDEEFANEPPADIAVEDDDITKPSLLDLRHSVHHHNFQDQNQDPSINEDIEQNIPPEVTLSVVFNDRPKFDKIWATLYLASMAMLFSTSLIIWLKTSIPKVPLGDTIYTVLKNSWGTLFTATFVSLVVSVVWIMAIKKFSTLFLHATIGLVPIGLFTMSIYPTVMSYRTPDGGFGKQDKAMRWVSLVPFICAVAWCFVMYKARRALSRSLGLVQLSCNMVSENPFLIVVGMVSVLSFLIMTVVWVGLFGRVFLQGHVFKKRWILDAKSWSLGAWYVLMYLWTWGVVSGIIRSTVSASISQWYFHRHELPRQPNRTIVKAAFVYSVSSQFGTICFASLIHLFIRLPFLILPKRIVRIVQTIVFNLLNAAPLWVVSPLTLTNSVINTQSLLDSARAVNNLRSLQNASAHSIYSLSKLVLTSARLVTSTIMAFACWVHAASFTNGGSLYGYIVGMVGGFIGWAILGATEGVLSQIVDAAFVCYALDHVVNIDSGHCVDADNLFQ